MNTTLRHNCISNTTVCGRTVEEDYPRLVARIEHGPILMQSMQAHEPITNDDAVNQEELSCLSWRLRGKKLMTFVMTRNEGPVTRRM